MFNSFISVVSVIKSDAALNKRFLLKIHEVLKSNFSDYEIVLVNNQNASNVMNGLKNIAMDVMKDVTVINLSKKVEDDNAIVAGLDRANGDYCVIFDLSLADKAHLLIDLYKKVQENYDVVYLRYKKRIISRGRKLLYRAFYYLMKKYSKLDIDIQMHTSRIMSRRSLNAILLYRENSRYIKGLYSFIGYSNSYIEVDDLSSSGKEPLSEQINSAVKAILAFTDLPNRVLFWLFITSFLFCILVSLNALSVKFLFHDMFWNPVQEVPGWAFIVLVTSFGFSLQTFILYVLSLFLTGINREIKNRPLYNIESISRL